MSDAKRPAEAPPADAPPAAKQRSSDESSNGGGESSSSASSEQQQPTPPRGPSPAEEASSQKVGVELRRGMQLEVRWVLEEQNEETGEAKADPVWWPCTLGDWTAASKAQGVGDWEWAVAYEPMEERGFGAEERTVAFQTRDLLVDLQTRRESASSGGGDEEGLMQWRVAGDEREPPELLLVGTRIKAQWKGGDEHHAGRVAGINLDGTYRVDYADGSLESSVARDLIEVVEVEPTVEQSEEEDDDDDGNIVMGSEAMFDLVIGRMVRGPAFSSLPPDKQRVASEKIAGLKVLFEAELEQLRRERGAGALVTQEDVMQILPRIMAASSAQGGGS
jgi:hypothetical protein